MEHRKPTASSRKLDPAKQAAFIRSYEALLNHLPADEAVMFADAVHPTHAVRAVGCWAPKDIPVAITQSSGRERLNMHRCDERSPVRRPCADPLQSIDRKRRKPNGDDPAHRTPPR